MNHLKQKNIYIIFPHGVDIINPFFNPTGDPDGDWIEFRLKQALEKAGYSVKFTQTAEGLTDVAAIISWEVDGRILANLAKYPREICFLLAFEPPHVRMDYYMPQTKKRFGKIFVFFDDIVDKINYFRFYFPAHEGRCFRKPDNIPDFDQKKLAVATHSNVSYTYHHPNELYTVRKNAFHFFSQTGEFDLYGRGWEGFAHNQMEIYKKYKFLLIYENWMGMKGYITERIFSGLSSGSIPVYYGAVDIQDYVPSSCFIDIRNFNNLQDLYIFLKLMDRTTYYKYIDEIKEYLKSSEKLKLFTRDNWVQTIMNHMPDINCLTY